jgi:hypothetical protein
MAEKYIKWIKTIIKMFVIGNSPGNSLAGFSYHVEGL